MASYENPFSSREAAEEAFARHVSRGKVDTFRSFGLDLVVGDRQGAFVHDAYSDRNWFNCHCNGGVFNLGHRNPAVVQAMKEALEVLDVGNHHLVSPYRARLAQRLAETTDNELEGVVFGVGGGEAIDLAIKMARASTGRSGILSARGGYHGHTGLAMATGDPEFRDPFGPNPPGFFQVPFNDLAALDEAMDSDTAGVDLEAIPATLGMPIPSEGYLKGVKELCDSRGAKFILDEVQTGLGRTGTFWFFQQEKVVPDILVTGKGLSAGIYPITATLMKREIHDFFITHPFAHISTFGGADIGCVVALAGLDIVQAPGFLERVNRVSDRLDEAFESMPFTLRRRGLMMGLKFDVEGAGMMAAKLLYDAGVFCVYANNDTSVCQFLPPLNLTDELTEELIERVRKAFP